MALPRSDDLLQTTGSTQTLTAYNSAWSITEGSDWSVPSGAGYATAPGSATDQTAMFDGGETWPDDQYAVVELGAATGHYRGPATRLSSGFGYHIDYTVGDTTVYFSLRNSGSNSNPTSWTISALSAGDFLRLESEGTTHRAYYATASAPTTWNLIGSHTDATISSGKPGMFAYTVTNDADTIRWWQGGALSGGSGPAITAISDSAPTNGQSITITGTGFGASQGAGSVNINGSTAQTVTAWSDTSITITVVRGVLRYLTAYDLTVTDNSAVESAAESVTLQPDADWGVITLTSIAGSGVLETSPILAIGDDVHWDTQGGSVDVFADGTWVYDPGVTPGVTSFDFEAWTTGDGWGSVGTQSIGGEGAVNVTLADATVSASGSLLIEGASALTLAGATASAAGDLAITGSLSSALADASVSASGVLVGAIAGVLSVTLADAAVSSAGALAIAGAASITLADATVEASGTAQQVAVGTLSVTLADATVAATGVLPLSGAASLALDGASLSAAGILPITGTVDATLDGATLVATGSSLDPITGSLSVTLADCTVAASATIADAIRRSAPRDFVKPWQHQAEGSVAVTLEGATVKATGKLKKRRVTKARAAVALDYVTVKASGISAKRTRGLWRSKPDDLSKRLADVEAAIAAIRRMTQGESNV